MTSDYVNGMIVRLWGSHDIIGTERMMVRTWETYYVIHKGIYVFSLIPKPRNGIWDSWYETSMPYSLLSCRTAIMDAYLDPSDILDLFTDLAEKRAIDCIDTIRLAQDTITDLETLTRKDD